MLSINVDSARGSATSKKSRATKKTAEPKEPKKRGRPSAKAPQSTHFTSPAREPSRSRKGKALVVDEEDDEDDEDETNLELDSRGYARDNFIVSDDEGDEDDGFEPLPANRATRGRSNNLGPPIQQDVALEDLPEIHQDIVHSFVEHAKKKEEGMRNRHGWRKPLFTEQHFREMAIRWTITLAKMTAIPGIDKEKVRACGNEFLPLIQRFYQQYQEMMGDSLPPAGGGNDADVVDLISSDGEFEDFDEEDEGAIEASKYFDDRARGGNAPRPPGEWRGAFSHMSQPHAGRSQPSPPRAKGPAAGKAGKRFFRKASGGGASGSRKASGGVTKRRTSTSSGRKASGAFGGNKSSRGGGHGGPSIGMMPM
jgi:bloom syndrome protein